MKRSQVEEDAREGKEEQGGDKDVMQVDLEEEKEEQ
jgi:hypothetical protein